MQARFGWAASALVWYGILVLSHRTAAGTLGSDAAFRWFYGLGFFVFGVVLLGAVARWWRRGSPALWRPAMLSVGSLAAAAEIALLPAGAATVPADLWMVALLGLVGAALLARLLPDSVNHHWLGIDRRAYEPGA